MKSPLGDPIASSTVVLSSPSGERRLLTVKIGRPYTVDELEARCPVAIDGLDGQYVDIAGNDTLQALGLATRLARTRLEDQLTKGARLTWPGAGEDEDVDLDILFGAR